MRPEFVTFEQDGQAYALRISETIPPELSPQDFSVPTVFEPDRTGTRWTFKGYLTTEFVNSTDPEMAKRRIVLVTNRDEITLHRGELA